MVKISIDLNKDCACRRCQNTHKCDDFYRIACKDEDCTKCNGSMRQQDCNDFEEKVTRL